MKTILFSLAFLFLSNLSFSQIKIGYEYNYEIKFDISQFTDKEPQNTIRKFVDYIFEAQNKQFNIQTRYSESGVIYISSDSSISKCIVEDFFHAEKSIVFSFEEKPPQFQSLTIKTKNNFAEN